LAYLEDKMQMLDLLRKVTAASGFTHASGVEVVAAEVGQVTLDLPKKRELLQFSGFFHGGVIAGLADHSAGAAATAYAGPWESCSDSGLAYQRFRACSTGKN